jgi:4-diphosphocytidyl-2-C-methyl-D-erythritol kinase
MEFSKARSLSLQVNGDYPVPADGTNLVMRAALKISERFPGLGARIRLTKRIPPGSGLGGGSSNAAVTLLGLDRLWETDSDPGLLHSMAQELGSDVPFFLYGGACLGLGRGDLVLPLPDRPDCKVLVVWPGSPLSTEEVYRSTPLTRGRILSSMRDFLPEGSGRVGPLEGVLRGGELGDCTATGTSVDVANDLEEAAFAKVPVLRHLKEELIASGAFAAAMTGSGSAAFGLFPESSPVDRLASSLAVSGGAVFVCKTQTREAYRRNLLQFQRSEA